MDKLADDDSSGVSVTFVCQMDWRYYNAGLKIIFAPGAKMKKSRTLDAGWAGVALLSLFNIPDVHIIGGTFEGKTSNFNASIEAGDDGIRVSSCRRVLIEHCYFKDFGDSAIRANTSTRDPLSTLPSTPAEPVTSTRGVTVEEVTIRDNYFNNIHQISTTTDDYLHGGAAQYRLENNTFENLAGSVKFASRVPGARNLYILKNTIKNSLDKGFEIDSYSNILILGNSISNCATNGLYIVSNDVASSTNTYGLGVLGFPFDGIKITDNFLYNCGTKTDADVASITFKPDTYDSGYQFTYKNVQITNNAISFDPGFSSNNRLLGFDFNAGSYQDLTIHGNTFTDFKGDAGIKLVLRGNVADLENRIRVENNNISMENSNSTTSTSGTAIVVTRIGGQSEQLTEVNVKNNLITGTCFQAFFIGFCDRLTLSGNKANMTGRIFNGGEINDMFVYDNQIETTDSALGWNFGAINGLYFYNNYTKTGGGLAAVSLRSTVQNVWYINNRVTGGTENFRSVPINTKALNKVGRREDGTGIPSTGTWRVGDILDFTNATTGGAPGMYCTAEGTQGTLSGITATTNGTSTVTFTSTNELPVGTNIKIAGGVQRRITAVLSGTQATVDGSPPTSGSGQAVTFAGAVFQNFAELGLV